MKNKFLTVKRAAGLSYLGLCLTGYLVGYVFNFEIYTGENASTTAATLVQKASFTRLGIAIEWISAGFQILVATLLYKLYSKENRRAAGILFVFGCVNTILIGLSAVTGLNTLNGALTKEPVELLVNSYLMHETIWRVSGILFGLWLLPLGYLALKVKDPIVVVVLLFVGASEHILSALVAPQMLHLEREALHGMTLIPASLGELVFTVYLLIAAKSNIPPTAHPNSQLQTPSQ